jgi:hypothetical protein
MPIINFTFIFKEISAIMMESGPALKIFQTCYTNKGIVTLYYSGAEIDPQQFKTPGKDFPSAYSSHLMKQRAVEA